MAHRVVILLTLWLFLWMGLGAIVGQFLFYTFWTGVVNGFVFAVVTTLLWPWVLPPAIDRWVDGVKA